MPASLENRSMPHALERRQVITGCALAIVGVVARPLPVIAEPNAELSHSEESIHQERTFRAQRKRVYAALTIERQFDRIVRLSGIIQADANAKMRNPTRLSPHVGGSFALFDGHIEGRQLELVDDELIVQAWRVRNWPRGVYSIARFELSEQAGVTKIVFDHTGFPKGDAEHLASGWQEHYWDPLTKVLA